MGGAGGFVNTDSNQALDFFGDRILTDGYATASTDTGHAVPNARDGAWALGDWEAIVNYAHLGMHRAVVHAKRVIEDHYARPLEKSFFFGCSNGGRQALMEAQRYPEDFDGIVAGAPWLNWTGQVAAFIAIAQKMFPDPGNLSAALVTQEDRLLLRGAILKHCDALDDLHDGILHDPTACDLDPDTLACPAEKTSGDVVCLTPDSLAAIREVYEGPVEDGARLYFGFPFGAEDLDRGGWGAYLASGAPSAGFPNNSTRIGFGAMRYFLHHDPGWNHTEHDWSRWRRGRSTTGKAPERDRRRPRPIPSPRRQAAPLPRLGRRPADRPRHHGLRRPRPRPRPHRRQRRPPLHDPGRGALHRPARPLPGGLAGRARNLARHRRRAGGTRRNLA